LQAYQKCLHQIQELGASLIAISPQTPDNSQAMLLKNFLQYEVLSDQGNRVAREYGLAYPLNSDVRRIYAEFGVDLSIYNADNSWELPLPGTFVIDCEHTIRHCHVDADPSNRLEPEVIISVLEKLQLK
jgi:peroxiredoxin